MSELKPCPFCGGEPEELTHEDESTTIHCTGPDCGMVEMGYRYPREKAVAAWNRRALHPEHREAKDGTR